MNGSWRGAIVGMAVSEFQALQALHAVEGEVRGAAARHVLVGPAGRNVKLLSP
jgi:hypothetical protein